MICLYYFFLPSFQTCFLDAFFHFSWASSSQEQQQPSLHRQILSAFQAYQTHIQSQHSDTKFAHVFVHANQSMWKLRHKLYCIYLKRLVGLIATLKHFSIVKTLHVLYLVVQCVGSQGDDRQLFCEPQAVLSVQLLSLVICLFGSLISARGKLHCLSFFNPGFISLSVSGPCWACYIFWRVL